jgi:hypothetical protein
MAYGDLVEREAIRTLEKIARNELDSGRAASMGLRIEAAKALATYLPHPEAVQAIEDLMKQPWLPEDLRAEATKALRKNLGAGGTVRASPPRRNP